ncbi:hypothetical protein V1512DRAFT_267345 [Lipomyces arxii]|uniref:uncharacterized protein n=1 Tax=Lipomyces arxii TaxID=56418 RepID=UPI0034CEDCF3
MTSVPSKDRSKRILITSSAFPRYHSPVSCKYSNRTVMSSSSTNKTPSHELYANLKRGQSEQAAGSNEVQAKLVQVGMKIRKSVSEGYKRPKETNQRATKAYSDSTLIIDPYRDDVIKPYRNDSLFANIRKTKKRQFDDSSESESEAETVIDEEEDNERGKDVLMEEKESQDSDFGDAPFLVPKDIIMSL